MAQENQTILSQKALEMKKASQTGQAPHQEPLINEHEAARILGLKVSTLRRWRYAGKPDLPFHKIGSAVRYDPLVIRDFIEAGRRTSTSDAGSEGA